MTLLFSVLIDIQMLLFCLGYCFSSCGYVSVPPIRRSSPEPEVIENCAVYLDCAGEAPRVYCTVFSRKISEGVGDRRHPSYSCLQCGAYLTLLNTAELDA